MKAQDLNHRLKLLPRIPGPYFHFLLFPVGQCWARRGVLVDSCFHNAASYDVQDAIVSVFRKQFEAAHSDFNFYGPTEYAGVNLKALHDNLASRIKTLCQYRSPITFTEQLPAYFQSCLFDEFGEWHPNWRTVRNEIEIYGVQLLRLTEKAEQQGVAILVMGI